jgi:hypothetical protein
LETELIRKQIGDYLEQGSYTDPTLKIVRFCKNLLNNFSALWTFIFVEGVEPTNNHAERCLRPAVIWRKNPLELAQIMALNSLQELCLLLQLVNYNQKILLNYSKKLCTVFLPISNPLSLI